MMRLRTSLGWILLGVLLLLVVLVPFALWEEDIARWAEQVRRSSESRILVAMLLAGLLALDIALPVPSSVVSTALGSLLGFGAGALASWLGMTVGCVLGYGLASAAGHGAALRLVGTEELSRVSAAWGRRGDGMLILFRAVPVLAESSVFFAGMTRMPFAHFFLLTTASNLGISLVYAAVGALSVGVQSFLLAFAGAILFPLLALLLARWAG